MARTSPTKYPNGVRVVVAGDSGTGKSSLIVTAAAENFAPNVPPVLPPTRLLQSPDSIPITIVDTYSSTDRRGKLTEELKKADAVILTYACHRPETLDRLGTFWLPKLRDLEVKVPVIVAGCMLDKRDENKDFNLEEVMSPMMQQFREIETCMECSALQNIQVAEVFYYAQRTVLYPIAPLFDHETLNLNPRCMRALKRIFILCDHDKDGALNNDELNEFQVKCFNAPLQHSEIDSVKTVVQEQLPEGLSENGLTLIGFHFLHALFIERGKLETAWTVLRKFGYNNDLRLNDDQLLPAIKRKPDQSVELTNDALEFLERIFVTYDVDRDGFLRVSEVEDLFSTAPENPWNRAPYRDAVEKNPLGGLTLDGFLSEWTLMALIDPIFCVENLLYIGYLRDPQSAIRVTQRRRLDCKRQQSNRNVYQCFVFGPKEAGKTALLNSFVRRPFPEEYVPDSGDRYSVNVVDQPGRKKKTLVLREIKVDGVKEFLSKRDVLSTCDVAVFVHDSSCESSWKKATELLFDVASKGEATGYGVPCLIVAAKNDLDQYSTQVQDSTRVSQDLGIEAPIPVSTKHGDFNDIFYRIVRAAERPHSSIPETEAGRSRKHYHQLINRSVKFVSVGAAVSIVVLVAYRAYAARRTASS